MPRATSNARSSISRRSAWCATDQDDFINAAALLDTPLGPRELLHALKAIEAKLGRITTYRWGPRVIDLDILAYGDLTVAEPDLTIPHARLLERAFALAPLAEIDARYRSALDALPQAARDEVVRLPFAIRGLRPDDRDDARAAARLLARVAAEGRYLATEPPVDVDMLADRIARHTSAGPPWVAVERGRVIGEISLFGLDEHAPPERRRAAIGICVASDWRGRGVGAALLARAIETARERGIAALDLEVFPHNAPAIALYERFGFARTAVRRRAYPRKTGEVWDAIVMSRSLTAPVPNRP